MKLGRMEAALQGLRPGLADRNRRPAVLPYVYCTVLLAFFAFVYLATFKTRLDVNGDNATYYILGKALYQGQGYTYISAPAASPTQHPPPGYPCIIALTMALWSSDFSAIKLVNGVFFILSILVLFFLSATLTGNVHLAFVVSLAALCNCHLLHSSTIMMSESSFLFFSLLALLLSTRLAEEGLGQTRLYLLLFCLVVTYYIRTMGVALCAAVCLELAWRRQWKFFSFVSAVYVLAVLPWFIRSQRLGGNPYIDQLLSVDPYHMELGEVGLGDLVLRVFRNVQRYIYREIPDGLLYYTNRTWQGEPTASDWFIGVLFLALGGYGLYKMKEHRRLSAAYIGATGGILLLWPEVWRGTRFMQPLIPLLLLVNLNGLYALLVWSFKKAGIAWRVHPLMFLPLLLIYVPDLDYRHRLAVDGRYTNTWINYFALAEWVGGNTELDAIVACRKPGLFHLYANRKTVSFQLTSNEAHLLKDLKQRQVNYMVIDQLGYGTAEQYLLPAIQKYEDQFPLVYSLENPDTWLVKFHPSD